MSLAVRTRLSQGGALAAASTAAATIFCCLPFAAGVVGAGVAAFGARLAPLRPYLTGVSLALLALAFFQAYRPGAASCRGEECDAGRPRRYLRATVWVVGILVALLLTSTWWASWLIYWTL